MKLTLKNFRCYTNKTFDFGDHGLVLLSGMSGVGKSTVFMAINFCLYGTGTKLSTFGTVSCGVIMEFGEGLKINRTKRPNRLVVSKDGVEYDDLSGQGIIDEMFGKAFDTTSYVQQNSVRSFILMSPLEKLEFLEKFAFNDIDLGKIKGKCSSTIKRRNDELVYATSQLEMASAHLKTLSKPALVKFPIIESEKSVKSFKNLSEASKEKVVKNVYTKLKNTEIKKKRNSKKIFEMCERINADKLYLHSLQNKKVMLDKLCKQKTILESSLQSLNTEYKGDETLELYKNILNTLISKREILILEDKIAQDEKRLYDMQNVEKKAKLDTLKELQSKLWNTGSLEDTEEALKTQKELIADLQMLNVLIKELRDCVINEKDKDINKETLKNIEKELEINKERLLKLEMSKELYTCPSCETTLKLVEDKLEICKEGVLELNEEDKAENNESINEQFLKDTIAGLSKKYKTFSSIHSDNERKLVMGKQKSIQVENLKSSWEGIDDIEDETTLKQAIETLESLKNYKMDNLAIEKRTVSIKNDTGYSENLENFKNDIQKAKEKLNVLNKSIKNNDYDIIMTEEDLRNFINTQKQYKNSLEDTKERLEKIEEDILSLKSDFEDSESENNLEDLLQKLNSDINNNLTLIKSLQEESKVLEDFEIELNKNVQDLQTYKEYKEKQTKYEEWEDKVQKLTEEEIVKKTRYTASVILKDKIAEAESIAITNIISSINIHAQEYLEIFFPDNPINVRLLPFKTNKKGDVKPQINIEIDYKGSECDISSLSGGEMSRVVLAFTLGLSEIFNSPLLLLDECTASLDQDLTSIVMEGIKTNFSNKLVIVIAHQLVTGSFDRQICL